MGKWGNEKVKPNDSEFQIPNFEKNQLSILRQAQEPSFDVLRNHPSTNAQEPSFDMIRNFKSKINN